MHKTLLALLFCVLSFPLLALDADEMFADPNEEARAREIGRQLRCLKCRNQSIFDSNAGIAKDLRVVVRERMRAGDSDDEILTFVQARFGDYVLLKPPVATHTYVLWLTPLVLFLLGSSVAMRYIRRRQPVKVPVADLSEEERKQAKQLLNKDSVR